MSVSQLHCAPNSLQCAFAFPASESGPRIERFELMRGVGALGVYSVNRANKRLKDTDYYSIRGHGLRQLQDHNCKSQLGAADSERARPAVRRRVRAALLPGFFLPVKRLAIGLRSK